LSKVETETRKTHGKPTTGMNHTSNQAVQEFDGCAFGSKQKGRYKQWTQGPGTHGHPALFGTLYNLLLY